MIDRATIDRIIDAADIVDVVSDYVTLRRAGASYKGLCPFHDDTTPSFSVSPAKGLCKCFSCGKGGNAVHFIMEIENLGYYDALKFLAKKYGIEVKERDMTDEERRNQDDRESMFVLNEWASKYYHDILLKDTDGRSIGLAYFRSRGFRDDIIEKFRLGFSLSKPSALYDEARKKGFSDNFLFRTGLCYKRDDGSIRDRFSGRAMFPWFTISGKICAFGGRVLDSRTKGVSQKYVNSPDSDIYHKSNELYGIYQAKKSIAKEDRVYMVEGYTDVISMHQCGIENVVANSGTALNKAQVNMLKRLTKNITLLYDGDEAGIHAALRGTDMFLSGGMNVKVLLLPDGDDPDSFARKHNATEYKEYIEKNQTDFITFKSDVLMRDAGKDPVKRANLIQDIVQSIAIIPDEIQRTVYIHECSEMLGVEEKVLTNAVRKSRKEAWEQKNKERKNEEERAARLSRQQEQSSAEAGGQNDTTDGNLKTPTQDTGGNGQPVVAENASSPVAQATPLKRNEPDDRFVKLEGKIMNVIVRYGERKIDDEEDDGKTVVEYVKEQLDEDELTFHSPVYKQMLEEAFAHCGDAGFEASRFFQSSTDVRISMVAVDMLEDRYQQSKIFNSWKDISDESRIAELVNHLLVDYKMAVVEDELSNLQKQMKQEDVRNDSEKCGEIMEKYMILKQIEQKLALKLGDRILFK